MKKFLAKNLTRALGALALSICLLAVAHGEMLTNSLDETDDAAIMEFDYVTGGADFYINIVSPDLPIEPSDTITLRARSYDYIFNRYAYEQQSSYTVNGSNIVWDIYTHWLGGDGWDIMCWVEDSISLEPLPEGDYQVTVNWYHTGGNTIGGVTTGSGSTTFSVVPEPATLTMLLTATFMALCLGSTKTIRRIRK
ncbi:MAG: hypothetical protein PVH19_12250 [Planctomycetia bacterium]|jgi:hypothetical protein